MVRARLAALAVLVVLAALAGNATGGGAAASDPTDHRASPPGGGVRDEPSVAVHPTRPKVLATAANDNTGDVWGIGVYASRDGGLTYTGTRMPLLNGTAFGSDPHLAYDRRGRLHSLYLSYGQDRTKGGLVIARSDDGGWRWPIWPTVVRANHRQGNTCRFADFPALAVDPRPGRDTVYAVWQEIKFRPASTCENHSGLEIMLSTSTDGGRHWSRARPVEVKSADWSYLPSLTVGPDGTVYVTYNYLRSGVVSECPSSLSPLATGISRSRDGGRTFTTASVARFCAPGTPLAVSLPGVGAVGLSSSTGAQYRLPASSNTVADPRTGRLLTVIGTQAPSTSQQVIQAFASADRGETWQPAGAVPISHGEHQQFPRVAVGKDGRVSLLWLAQLPGGVLQASHSWSMNGGKSWRPVQRIASMPSPITHPYWLGFIGDYLGNAIGPDGRAHPVWTDLREWDDSSAGGTVYTRALAP